MRNILLAVKFLLVIILLTSCQLVSGQEAIVRVQNRMPAGGNYFSSGVVIRVDNQSSLVLSSAHAGSIKSRATEIIWPDGSMVLASRSLTDPTRDLVLYEVPIMAKKYRPIGQSPKVGDRVCGVGYDGKTGRVRHRWAWVQSVGHFRDQSGPVQQAYEVGYESDPGDSGGPILNEDGRVVGIVQHVERPGTTQVTAASGLDDFVTACLPRICGPGGCSPAPIQAPPMIIEPNWQPKISSGGVRVPPEPPSVILGPTGQPGRDGKDGQSVVGPPGPQGPSGVVTEAQILEALRKLELTVEFIGKDEKVVNTVKVPIGGTLQLPPIYVYVGSDGRLLRKTVPLGGKVTLLEELEGE